MRREASDSYSAYTVTQLKARLRDRQIPFNPSARKEDLIRLLCEADNAFPYAQPNQRAEANDSPSRRSSATESIPMADDPPRGGAYNTRSGSKPQNAKPKAKGFSILEFLQGLFTSAQTTYPWPVLISIAFGVVFLSMFLTVLVLLCAMFQTWAPVTDVTSGAPAKDVRRWGWLRRGVTVVQVAAAGMQLWWWLQ
ncbi:MAG: hypothetical protein Q9219_005076 [cf. Caloplaca sp. 3 TL-2023]